MNYTVTINNQTWQTLTFDGPTPLNVILSQVADARSLGQLSAFEQPDGSWNIQVAQS